MHYSLPRLDEAILFSIALQATASELADFESTLSRDELWRANRFLLPEIRIRYVICRGVLRDILGKMLNCSASEVLFRYEKWGKPQLATADFPGLHFNLSHSADRAVIAFAGSPLGIDIELPNDRLNARAIASQVVSQVETRDWNAVPAKTRSECIMQLWVCKEALLKAMGLGIAEGLTQVGLPIPIPLNEPFSPIYLDPNLQIHLEEDGTCRMNSWIDAKAWKLRMLDMGDRCFAALATSPAIKTIAWSNFESQPRPH